jgi:hypothetical protein
MESRQRVRINASHFLATKTAIRASRNPGRQV